MDYIAIAFKAVCIGVLCTGYLTFQDDIHDTIDLIKVKSAGKLCVYIQKATIKFVKMRSKYVWTDRVSTNVYAKTLLDRIFLIDPVSAALNTSNKASERIYIGNASVTRGDTTKNVTKEMREIMVDFDDSFTGDNGQITVDLLDIVPEMSTDTGEDDSWYLEVTYRGHSDVSKKIEAQQYSVKYKSTWNDIITFPPYSITEKPSKGLGSKKVVSALSTADEDVVVLAKEYAGLKCNFYEDCSDEVLKNHMSVSAVVQASKGVKYLVEKRS